MEKICSACGQSKPLSEFHKENRSGAYRARCKVCTRIDDREYYNSKGGKNVKNEYYHSNKEGIIERIKQWAKSPSGRTSMKKADKNRIIKRPEQEKNRIRDKAQRYRDKNPLKVKARSIIRGEIRKGKLPLPSSQRCCECGKQAQEYHHIDYSKPLIVKPVCRICHRILDKRNI